MDDPLGKGYGLTDENAGPSPLKRAWLAAIVGAFKKKNAPLRPAGADVSFIPSGALRETSAPLAALCEHKPHSRVFFTPKALKGDLLDANPYLNLSPYGVG